MNVVDSSGWLEYFGKGANGERFAPVIQAAADLVVPTITLYEVFRRVLVQRGEEEALSAIGWMALGQVAVLTQELALEAAALSVEHKLPMADSIILATAHARQATLWTQDEHLRGFPGVEYIPRSS
jgi:predicted nucleic acid-binding protein